MPKTAHPAKSVLLFDPRRLRSARLLRSLAETKELSLTGCAKDLTQAYNLTEHEHPDLVILGEEVTLQNGFPMFAAMLAALEIECLLLTADDTGAPGAFEKVGVADIDRTGGIGPYLVARYKIFPQAPAFAAGLTQKTEGSPVRGVWNTVVIGASTGGVEALIEVLSSFPPTCPPTLIVQHINASFLPGLAQRLDRHCAASVRPAADVDAIKPGQVLMAPGDSQHLVISPPGQRCQLISGDPMCGHRPSIDMLFQSASGLGTKAVGVILTGMGRDGADGLAAIRRSGGWTIAQDEATSTVYGMPRAAQQMGAAIQQLPLTQIGPALLKAAARPIERTSHG